MMLSKDMLKEFVEGAKAEKVKDFTFKLIDQLNQVQLNAVEQGFKVSLQWQGADCPEPQRPARTPVIEPQAMPRRGRPPKMQESMIPEPPSDEEEGDEADDEDDGEPETAEDLFQNIEKTLSGAKPRKSVDETEKEFDRVMRNSRRMNQ